MRRDVSLLVGAVCSLLTLVAVEAHGSPAENYLLHCEGCHQHDGAGLPGYVPDFRGSVARFLRLEEGRRYLGRVPGTSQSLLNDAERAEVLNWIVTTFDGPNVPPDFVQYSAQEMAVYRRDPQSQANAERDRLIRLVAAEVDTSTVRYVTTSWSPAPARTLDPGQAPPQFALCAACHPTSSDGASAMGPNLRGIVGRRSGSLPGFRYSPAMTNAGIAWSRESLDEFLADVQKMIPGSMMAVASVDNPADRAAIIAYLETLR